jgi:hypothetical protein
MGRDGHGSAWQFLAAKVGKGVPRLLGVDVDLCRGASLVNRMVDEEEYMLTSLEDLERWELRDEGFLEMVEKAGFIEGGFMETRIWSFVVR